MKTATGLAIEAVGEVEGDTQIITGIFHKYFKCKHILSPFEKNRKLPLQL